MTKHIFITGGVVSSLGKGLTAASLGLLLEASGLTIRMQKLDPYLNIDPGMMSPFQHGEVYVLDDGTETDLDLGHYERFTNSPLSKNSSLTSGKIYRNVLRRERQGKYHGKTLQVIPHITNEIKRVIRSLRSEYVDVILTEIGGTVGDIESLPFLEAIRQFALDIGRENCLFLHLTLIPYLKSSAELKTKPTQYSVSRLRQIGIQPDILVCRTEHSISDVERNKIALFCNLESRNVIEEKDADFSIYEVPITLHENGLDRQVIDYFWKESISSSDNVPSSPEGRTLSNPLHKGGKSLNHSKLCEPNLTSWHEILDRLKNPLQEINVAVIGKYARHKDAYKSVYEALDHAGIKHQTKINVLRIPCKNFDSKKMENVHGILVPGGLGDRCEEGNLAAVRFARENNIPFFGINLGLHCAVVEFARNVAGFEGADSTEFNPHTFNPIISQYDTVRLGAKSIELRLKSKAVECYGAVQITERCRNRWGFFYPEYYERMQQRGLMITAKSEDGDFAEGVELEPHPWFIAVQYHPEYKSQPTHPHPLFAGFVAAAVCKCHS